MNKVFNSIALKFLSSIHISKQKESFNEVAGFELSMFNMDLAHLGYSLDKTSMDVLRTLSINDLNQIKEDTISVLSGLLGSNKSNIPLFKNFPYDIPNADEYLLDRMVGFISQIGLNSKNAKTLTCGHVIDPSMFDLEKFGACPICQRVDEELQVENKLPDLSQVTKLKLISVVNDKEVYSLFKKLINSKTNLSTDFKSVILDVFKECGSSIKGLLPRKIEIKENAAFISSLLVGMKGADAYISSYIKTATDVLRFAVACSAGDISLASNTKFKLTKKQKKTTMSLLNNIDKPLEDLKRYRNEWLILSKLIHIGAFKDIYPKAFKAIDTLRNDEKSIKTFESGIEDLVYRITQEKSTTPKEIRVKDGLCFELSAMLSDRSGVFARRLDFILRNASVVTQKMIAVQFIETMDSSSNNVLLGLKKMLENRNELSYRVFMPKGSALRMKRGSCSEGVVDHSVIVTLCDAITKKVSERFLEKGTFKNVFIDPLISKMIVPFAMRSNSSGAPAMTRGSRIKLDETTDIVRFFTQWHDVDQSVEGNEEIRKTVDLDLSAVIYDDKFGYVDSIYYGDHHNAVEGETHYSGDIQDGSGKNGSFEAIDINIEMLKKRKNSRYVVMCLNSYLHQSFSSFEASAGVMERTEVGGGQAFEPKTVKNRFSLSGDNKNGIPLIIDLETREMIWVDIQNNVLNHQVNNVVNNNFSISESVKVFSEFEKFKMTMLELVELHKLRFENIDYIKDESKEYDLELDMDFARNLPEVVANWL